MEVFTNCATAPTSSLLFLLLLSGAGVGRAYDDALMRVDWSYMPTVICVIDQTHADVQSGEIKALDRRSAEHLYAGKWIHNFDVPDSREGWGQAVEQVELMAYERSHVDDVLILDFSGVRCRGTPIKGMQDRPASGPGPLMDALANVARIKNAGMAPWRQTMYVDHYLAECVLVGGARRAARMSTKTWRDKNVLSFISLKEGGFLWSSNNSVTIDQEFRGCCATGSVGRLSDHARKVFDAVCEASYSHGTGEPGFINQDRLTDKGEGLEFYLDGKFIGSRKFTPNSRMNKLLSEIVQVVIDSDYRMITNPCGEICLVVVGGYCLIGDVVPYHARPEDRWPPEPRQLPQHGTTRLKTPSGP